MPSPAKRMLLLGLALALLVVNLHAAPISHRRRHSHDSVLSKLSDRSHHHHHHRHHTASIGAVFEAPVASRQVATSDRFPVGPMAEPGLMGLFGPRVIDDFGILTQEDRQA
ncbi:hypothetical protein ACRE_079130 [Hapsidospora chrysogenum ATCC 11550]|uniref:Uncharacterized protein n=1 Tax=Hapsidospora chrysogenum (strain ATCC 11550 / CBS 779.69 / DSM 880 / IAM 14645 / JCM 23072 / IMI 49137) TaxID=857340 RepID=A0A086SW84_HAPC1|nr:hypothetical protein ACRE_079130 [Hapsidospora chrysogenum ATCC 11550]